MTMFIINIYLLLGIVWVIIMNKAIDDFRKDDDIQNLPIKDSYLVVITVIITILIWPYSIYLQLFTKDD